MRLEKLLRFLLIKKFPPKFHPAQRLLYDENSSHAPGFAIYMGELGMGFVYYTTGVRLWNRKCAKNRKISKKSPRGGWIARDGTGKLKPPAGWRAEEEWR